MTTLRFTITSLILFVLPRIAAAESGLGNADEINVGGGGGGDLRGAIVRIVLAVLSYVALIAVVVIIIAGIWMIVGLGEESSKERAKKIVIYTIIGLILILIARAIVTFVINTVG
ncbi:MAG: hypothetical protein Q7S29_01135 [Candidatus Peribacter sp.]|nr:hypothetical protein [Candidatus Peribacter sp.]